MEKKYICKMKKEEIIKAIVEEFKKVSKDYDDTLNNENRKHLLDRNYGRYVAMMDLLQKVTIYEE